jgi:orotidine-5'-phosphate decarboxylase
MREISPIIVALDFPSAAKAEELVNRLDPNRCRVKVGKELFTRSGPQFIEKLHKQGYEVFLDLKYHDIPNTVAAACRAAADLGVWMVNVHTLGGGRMMEAAAEALANVQSAPKLIGVTILTSMGDDDLLGVGLTGTPAENVSRLARLAKASGLDGVVCSPKEVSMIREKIGENFDLVTPGIRPKWSVKGDQVRVTTPAQAIEQGSDYLVIGRPITGADIPLDALSKIEQEIGN